MKDIVWKKEDYCWDGFPLYYATIGHIRVRCEPVVFFPYDRDDLKRLVGWDFRFYGPTCEGSVVTRKSLEAAKKDAEKAVIEHLLSVGASMVTELKQIGMLEEVMSIAGIDL